MIGNDFSFPHAEYLATREFRGFYTYNSIDLLN